VDTVIPFIDGGTEGFKGQSRLILPGLSACFECTLSMFPPATTFPFCTLAHTPRVPEHCVQWANLIAWDNPEINKTFPKDTKVDNDNPDHINWLFETAKRRAEEHKIQGVTYKLTQGVVKNIIPAIASTNAIVAAECCNEALKLATSSSDSLNNYMMYNGLNGVYTYTFEMEQRDGCAVCGQNTAAYDTTPSSTLQQLVEYLLANENFQFKKPSLRSKGKNLYMQGPLEAATRPNLEKTLEQLNVQHEDELNISDPSLPRELSLRLTVRYS